MTKAAPKLFGTLQYAIALVLVALSSITSGARADEADARKMLKTMSDYMAAQKALSLAYDTNLEFVSKDKQKFLLASSGTVTLARPDKMRATRQGGFADIEMVFDGKTLTLLGKDANAYGQVEVPGTLDNLIDVLREKHQKPVPGADLLMSNVYDELMSGVTNIKDLGSGVIGGVECDHLAFRKKDVDFQIWIAQGSRPYPCRLVITSKLVAGTPQYSVQVRDFKAGNDVTQADFSFKSPPNAKKVDLKELDDTDELPKFFRTGAAR